MNSDLDAEDALLRAISDLRGLMDQLIDEQISHLNRNGGRATPGDPFGTRPFDRALGPFAASSPGLRTAAWAAPASERIEPASASPSRPAPRLASVDVPAATRPNRFEPENDSRQRLDALAKHLDDRLRRARDAVRVD